jgi:hypothetical protein
MHDHENENVCGYVADDYKISIHCSELSCIDIWGGGAADRNGFRDLQEESSLAFW